MQKLCLTALLLLCFSLPTNAYAENNNWCGIYFEENDQGFIRIPISDIRTGSGDCNGENYTTRTSSFGSTKIALDFTKNRSALGYWRKFNNHIIEIRGKLNYGEIKNPRLIRDLGI